MRMHWARGKTDRKYAMMYDMLDRYSANGTCWGDGNAASLAPKRRVTRITSLLKAADDGNNVSMLCLIQRELYPLNPRFDTSAVR